MKIVIPLIVALLLAGCYTVPGDLSEVQRRERLERILVELKTRFNIPAIGVIVVDSDRIVSSLTIGTRDIAGTDPAISDDYFHLGSNTKAVTAFIAGKLVRDGVLDWDTRFFDLVPELAEDARYEYADITLGQLLSHRAWIPPYLSGSELERIPELDGNIVDRRISFSRYVLSDKPIHSSAQSLFKPYAYSNAGYVLASVMIGRAAGLSWEELIEEVLFNDLRIPVYIGFPVGVSPAQPRGHLPGAYFGEGKDSLMVYDTEYVVKHDEVLNPAGNLSMPMTAYARFIQLHLRGLRGEDNYLPAEMYRFMHFGIDHYAMGWENSRKNGNDFSEHSGSRGNFFAHVRIIPQQDLAIIAFANSGIVNALNPVSYVFGGVRLSQYLNRIEALYAK